MGEQVTRGVVLGGGDILDYPTLAAKITAADIIICADSGYRHCAPLGVTASLLVGDFDSIGALPENIEKVTLRPDKNYTDTTCAVEEALARGCSELLLCGMLGGGRFDHTLANLAVLVACEKQGTPACITDGRTQIIPFAHSRLRQELVLPPQTDHYFSLLAYSEVCRNVTILGGKYPLNAYDLRQDEARAVSNEFIGIPVRISMDSGILLVVTTPKQ